MDFVTKIINQWDPIGLLPFAPSDEYHSEIAQITQLLAAARTEDDLAAGIDHVFRAAFRPEIFQKSLEDCRKIARMLWRPEA